MALPDLVSALLKACEGDGRYIGLALAELGVDYVEDAVNNWDFLVDRVRALREEDIIYNGQEDDD